MGSQRRGHKRDRIRFEERTWEENLESRRAQGKVRQGEERKDEEDAERTEREKKELINPDRQECDLQMLPSQHC